MSNTGRMGLDPNSNSVGVPVVRNAGSSTELDISDANDLTVSLNPNEIFSIYNASDSIQKYGFAFSENKVLTSAEKTRAIGPGQILNRVFDVKEGSIQFEQDTSVSEATIFVEKF